MFSLLVLPPGGHRSFTWLHSGPGGISAAKRVGNPPLEKRKKYDSGSYLIRIKFNSDTYKTRKVILAVWIFNWKAPFYEFDVDFYSFSVQLSNGLLFLLVGLGTYY